MTLWNELARTYLMADINGTWTDISDRVLIPGRGTGITASVGRSTELASIDPSTMALVLDNPDGLFTPGNATSPYYPYWTTGTHLRWSETIGARTFRHPDMWLELPEVALTFEAEGDSTHTDRVLVAPCVDLLTKLNRAPRFISNLVEWTRYNPPEATLQGYWPLNDAAGAKRVGPVTTGGRLNVRYRAAQTASLVTFGEDPVPADDGTSALFAPNASTGDHAYLHGDISGGGLATTGAAVSFWARQTIPATAGYAIRLDSDETPGPVVTVSVDANGVWTGTVATSGSDETGTVSSATISPGPWRLVTFAWDTGTNTVTMYVDKKSTTAATTGSELLPEIVDEIYIGANASIVSTGFAGNLAGVRVYAGDYTQAEHLAAYEAGLNGLGAQSVDERIRTILNYAGIPDSQLDLEASDSLIQREAFAGQRPGELASAAAVTGGGVLFTREDRLVYHDRRHRFNL